MAMCNFCGTTEEGISLFKGKTGFICDECVAQIQRLKLAKAKSEREQVKQTASNRAKLSKQLNHSFTVIDGGKV